LAAIAAIYGTSADLLASLNGIANPNQLDIGLVLLIPTAIPPSPTPTATLVPTVPPSSGITLYVVQAGDTLDGIARNFGTTVNAITQLNGIANPSLIFPGLVLQIPTDDSTDSTTTAGQPLPTPTATQVPTPTPLPTNIPTTYTVQTGDTLFQIANRFGVSVVELAAINNIIDYNQILVGQVLTIPG
jgi:LysM repeat protein